MSNTGGLEAAKPSPPHHKPRHQLTRSITELSSPIRLHRHSSNRRIKEKDRDRGKGRDRDRDDIGSVPLSAPVSHARHSLDGGFRSEGITPNLTPAPSRRASAMISASEDNTVLIPMVPNAGTGRTAVPAPAPPVMKEDELRREKQNAEAWESGLKQALVDVATTSKATTQRLDNAYYSVLEKVGTLQSTIIALRELTSMSHELSNTFGHEASELAGEISTQLDAFGAFEDQQTRVEMLQNRVRKGRARVGVLSDRLDGVQKRIERWETADREWQERTRRRLRATWVVISVIVVALLLMFLGAQYAPSELDTLEKKAAGLANGSLNVLKNLAGNTSGEEAYTSLDAADAPRRGGLFDKNGSLGTRHNPPGAADDMLRAFDEL